MTVNRDTARRNTTRARVASLALFIAAGAVFALPLPMLRSDASPVPVPDLGAASPDTAPQPKTATPPVDLDLAISSLWRLGPPPSDTPVPETPTPAAANAAKPATPAAPAVPDNWRYIGSIVGPRGMHAILERDGRQKLVKAGDEIDSVRIIAVDAAQVTIDEGNGKGEEQIKLSARASSWNAVPATASAAPPPRVNPNRAGVPVARPPAVPPQRSVYTEMSDEERERYEAEKLEKYREAGESGGVERSFDGRRR